MDNTAGVTNLGSLFISWILNCDPLTWNDQECTLPWPVDGGRWTVGWLARFSAPLVAYASVPFLYVAIDCVVYVCNPEGGVQDPAWIYLKQKKTNKNKSRMTWNMQRKLQGFTFQRLHM